MKNSFEINFDIFVMHCNVGSTQSDRWAQEI